ncbi:helix-turn-helix transcriptional regulator [Acinetobacter nectaris]|uniref:helix-turn-helix transcriptional regulator n=1 Tax=Acinetobacter nectaris TaxID=1219382 RepID=UPI001F45B96B|nr:AraC family transcriptional regulator [Acinetobacter nectaris]MCF9045685.1 helix-turn-helix transcriptional regulator [Acinetobacter nectaris]
MRYDILEQLQRFKTQLVNSVEIGSDIQLAHWKNSHDCVKVCSNHHTLSLYVKDGYETYQKTAHGWKNGGGPNKFCLMPQNSESTWDIRGNLSFVHLYYTQQHLQHVAEQVWDKSPNAIELNESAFVLDEKVSFLYQNYLIQPTWAHQENHLEMSMAASLLLTHMVKNYSNVEWQTPQVKGGLSPYALKYILEWIDAHLDQPLTLSQLAQQVHLSEHHFAHMFRKSMQIPPHQYVMQRRLEKVHHALSHTTQTIIEIAHLYGFSSASHMSDRFNVYYGYRPSKLR